MGIVRVNKHTDNYVVIDKRGLEDERLSFKAKGILAYLLSRPDNWNAQVNHLKTVSKDGKSAVGSGLQELEDYGYFHKDKIRNNDGTFKDWVRDLYETPELNPNYEPKADNPKSDNPELDNPELDNRNLTSNELISNDLTSKDNIYTLWASKMKTAIAANKLATLNTYLDELPIEVIERAMDKTLEHADTKGYYAYCKTILDNWLKDEIATVEDIEKLDKKHKEKSSAKKENKRVMNLL